MLAWSICRENFNGRGLAIGPGAGVLNSHYAEETQKILAGVKAPFLGVQVRGG
jgi:hypothetical protein